MDMQKRSGYETENLLVANYIKGHYKWEMLHGKLCAALLEAILENNGINDMQCGWPDVMWVLGERETSV